MNMERLVPSSTTRLSMQTAMGQDELNHVKFMAALLYDRHVFNQYSVYQMSSLTSHETLKNGAFMFFNRWH